MTRPNGPARARFSAEAKAAKRAADRVETPPLPASTPEQAFAQPPIPPLEEYQAYKVQPAVDPIDMEVVPDPDDPNFTYSRKNAPYNKFAPSRLRGEIKRRDREKDESKLALFKDGSTEWIKLKLIIEAKHCGKPLYRIRSFELLARIENMFSEVIELRGGLSKEDQLNAAKEAVTNFLKMSNPIVDLAPGDVEIRNGRTGQDTVKSN